MQQAIADPTRVHQFQRNAKDAAQVENWENECEILKRIYPKVDA